MGMKISPSHWRIFGVPGSVEKCRGYIEKDSQFSRTRMTHHEIFLFPQFPPLKLQIEKAWLAIENATGGGLPPLLSAISWNCVAA